MSDLISRSALMEELARNSIVKIVVIGEKTIWDIVKNQPTIEAVPVVHGEWIKSDLLFEADKCTICNSSIYNTSGMNFCPNCGAKMGGA